MSFAGAPNDPGIALGFSPVVARASGFALQNGTPTIVTATAPNDGNRHIALIAGWVNVTTAETGGQLTVTLTQNGISTPVICDAGGHTPQSLELFNNNIVGNAGGFLVDPGTTVTLAQSSALTAGAATVNAEICII